jgi:F420-0:gamma-glutamyl ligase
MKIRAKRTKIFKEGQSLSDFVLENIGKLKEGSVVVVTSKIVAMAEKRTVPIGEIKKEKLIKKESQFAYHGKYAWLTFREGMLVASAGIDESNARGKYVLLPKDSFKTAKNLRSFLMSKYKLRKLGVIITDSRNNPLRAGAVGVAISYAGFKGLRKYSGTPDIFGRLFHFSRANIADSLAASAVLVMGEGDQRKPVAVIEEAPIEFVDKVLKNELMIKPKDDMYLPFLSKLLKRKI